MRKKYLSALLFGALLVASTGTFTSCKDYDDDINNLQNQIDSQKGLSEKLAAVESSIAGLQTADAELQKKIDEAKDAAEKAALEAQQEAVKEAAEQLAGVKSELTAMIEDQSKKTEEAINAINEEIAKLQGSVQAIEKLNSDIEALQLVDAQLQASISELDAKIQANANKIGELETALKAQQDALEAYKESNGANVSAIQDDIKELQDKIAELTGSDDLGTITEQLEALQNEVKSISTQVSAINDKLDVLYAAWYEGVTSVSLVIKNEVAPEVEVNLLSAKSLTNRTFGEGLEGAIEFKKGDRTKLTQEILVRVSPVTATLNKEDIKFVNSLGQESLNDLVEVIDVDPYEELLSRGVNSASGLWVVKLQAKGNDAKFETAFDNATLTEVTSEDGLCNEDNNSVTKNESVLFAMKVVDNNSGNESARGVVSEYAITFGKSDVDPARDINFDVFVGTNKFCASELHNRAKFSEEDNTPTPKEYVWGTSGAQIEEIFEGALTNVAEGDNRQNKFVSGNALTNPVVESKGESFKVRINTPGATHYYITLDKDRAVTSDDSERETWEKLWESKITGINKVYSVNETPVATIGFTSNDINDVLGFRVYAINADGTLADPDGRAFYVRVGKVASVATASTSIIPDANTGVTVESKKVAVNNLDQFANNKTKIGRVLLTCDKYIFDASNKAVKYPFDITLVFEDGTVITTKGTTIYSKNDIAGGLGLLNEELSELAKIKEVYATMRGNNGWSKYVDDETYTSTLSFANDKGVVIGSIQVAVTKTMPTSLPAGFGWKETQLTGDTYDCFVLPWNQWEAGIAGEAYMHMAEIFNVDAKTSSADKYTFTFRTNNPKNDKVVEGYATVDPQSTQIKLEKNKGEFDMIDGKTKYATVIEYNYGMISSQHPTQDVKVTNLTAAEPKEYNLVYHNMFAKDHYAINWASKDNLLDRSIYATDRYAEVSIADQANQIKYGINFSTFIAYKDDKFTVANNLPLLNAVVAVSKLDKKYNKYLGELEADKHNYVKATKAEFITNQTSQASEYFAAKLNENGTSLTLEALQHDSPVRQAVPSTLKVTLIDSFGIERVVELPMSVVPNI